MKHFSDAAKPEMSPYLPGQLAGASLKHSKRVNALLNQPHLPGQLAGASLKQLLRHRRQVVRAEISPANWPGPH